MSDNIIKQLRERAGLTQSQVAEVLGVARATYATMENGSTEPSLTQIKALAKLYDISSDEIVMGKVAQDVLPVDFPDEEVDDIIPLEIPKTVDANKLRNVLLYLLSRVGARPNVGETVIYKLLYFIDFDYFEKYGKTITGLTYVKNTYGPTPNAQFSEVVDKMQSNHQLDIVKTSYFQHDQKKYLPVVEPDLSKLDAREIEHINWEIERLGEWSASKLSDFSHKDMPWIASKNRQPINPQLVFYRGAITAVTEPEDEL